MASSKFKDYISRTVSKPVAEGYRLALNGIKRDYAAARKGLETASKFVKSAFTKDEYGTPEEKRRRVLNAAKNNYKNTTLLADIIHDAHIVIGKVFLYPFRVIGRFFGLFSWPLRYAIITLLFALMASFISNYNYNLLLISGLSEEVKQEEKAPPPTENEFTENEEQNQESVKKEDDKAVAENDGKNDEKAVKSDERLPELPDIPTRITLNQLKVLRDAGLHNIRPMLAVEAAKRLEDAQKRIEEERKRAEEELKAAAEAAKRPVSTRERREIKNFASQESNNNPKDAEMKILPPKEDKSYLEERGEIKDRHIKEKYANLFNNSGFDTINLHYTELQIDALFQENAFAFFNLICLIIGILVWPMLIFSFMSFMTCFLNDSPQLNAKLKKIAYYGMFNCGLILFIMIGLSIFAMYDVANTLLGLNRKDFDSSARNTILFAYVWIWSIPFVLSIFAWLPLMRGCARKAFGLQTAKNATCDAIVENMTGKSEKSGLTRSTYWVFSYFFFFLMVVPLLRGCGPEDAYLVPKGDGGGQVSPQVQVQKKKKPKKKRIVVNPNSAFNFNFPDLDPTHSEELDEATAQTYTADPSQGTIGPGKKAGKPGWPDGMDDGVIRFIRLEYSGGDWDQDMGKGSDYNMLIKLNEYAQFKIANETESIKVADLRRFKRGFKPPFLFITGRGGINMTATEIKILRDYLINDGGMIFADNGGGSFNGSFRALCKRIFPELDLIDIANDDVIYKQPFLFPNGAPPLFAHSGKRALGMKHNGRWVVFYHQGDINDAWKTGGSGTTPEIQERAYMMGANVIAYSFGQYLAFNREYLQKLKKKR